MFWKYFHQDWHIDQEFSLGLFDRIYLAAMALQSYSHHQHLLFLNSHSLPQSRRVLLTFWTLWFNRYHHLLWPLQACVKSFYLLVKCWTQAVIVTLRQHPQFWHFLFKACPWCANLAMWSLAIHRSLHYSSKVIGRSQLHWSYATNRSLRYLCLVHVKDSSCSFDCVESASPGHLALRVKLNREASGLNQAYPYSCADCQSLQRKEVSSSGLLFFHHLSLWSKFRRGSQDYWYWQCGKSYQSPT